MMADGGVRNRTVRVLIVDDEPDLRLLLRTMLTLDQRIDIVGEAVDGADALARFEELRPDVLVLDQRMPVMMGLDVAREILAADPAQAVILLSAYLDSTIVSEALAMGIRSVIGKQDIAELAPEILRLVD